MGWLKVIVSVFFVLTMLPVVVAETHCAELTYQNHIFNQVRETFCSVAHEIQDGNSENESQVVPVADIVIANFKKTLKVDESVDISITIVPHNATTQNATFYSDNPAVASVNSMGKITGISSGTAVVVVEAGNIRKSIPLTIKIPTESIHVNSDFVALKTSAVFQLMVSVLPESADKNITYRSTDSTVATVTNDGVIEAKGLGSASIIISAWDASKIVHVVVNDGLIVTEDETFVEPHITPNANANRNPQDPDIKILEAIRCSADDSDIIVSSVDLPTVTSNILKELHGSRRKLIVTSEEYRIVIIGTEIVNTNNELNTLLTLDRQDNNLKIFVNNMDNLPGKLHIQLYDNNKYKYLYIYNVVTGKYEKLATNGDPSDGFLIDTPTEYLLTEKQLPIEWFSWQLAIGIIVGIVLFAGLFVVLRKRHLFW